MKLFTVKRGVAAIAAAVILISAAIGAVYGGMASAEAKNAPVIVIDAGHGGIDAGVHGKVSGV